MTTADQPMPVNPVPHSDDPLERPNRGDLRDDAERGPASDDATVADEPDEVDPQDQRAAEGVADDPLERPTRGDLPGSTERVRPPQGAGQADEHLQSTVDGVSSDTGPAASAGG